MTEERLQALRDAGAQVGDGVYLGLDVYIEMDFAPLLSIGDHAVISRGVSVLLHDSSLNNLIGAPIKYGRVVIGRGAYVGANSTVLCGVDLGPGSLVGACSLVTTDVPEGMVAVGQPARVVGTVQEVADRQAEQAGDPSLAFVEAVAWRDRTAADWVRVDADTAAAIAGLRAVGSDSGVRRRWMKRGRT